MSDRINHRHNRSKKQLQNIKRKHQQRDIFDKRDYFDKQERRNNERNFEKYYEDYNK